MGMEDRVSLQLELESLLSSVVVSSVSYPDPDSGVFWIQIRIPNPDPDPGL